MNLELVIDGSNAGFDLTEELPARTGATRAPEDLAEVAALGRGETKPAAGASPWLAAGRREMLR